MLDSHLLPCFISRTPSGSKCPTFFFKIQPIFNGKNLVGRKVAWFKENALNYAPNTMYCSACFKGKHPTKGRTECLASEKAKRHEVLGAYLMALTLKARPRSSGFAMAGFLQNFCKIVEIIILFGSNYLLSCVVLWNNQGLEKMVAWPR